MPIAVPIIPKSSPKDRCKYCGIQKTSPSVNSDHRPCPIRMCQKLGTWLRPQRLAQRPGKRFESAAGVRASLAPGAGSRRASKVAQARRIERKCGEEGESGVEGVRVGGGGKIEKTT